MTNELNPLNTPDQDSSITEAILDREALNRMTTTSLEPGVYFGRGIELSDYDREQLSLVASEADATLEPFMTDPRWAEFQALIKEGGDKGILISFVNHKGTNVPTWCVNGGGEAAVRKVIIGDGNKAGIEVPTQIFNLFHWQRTAEAIKELVKTSNETLKGRSAKYLGENLSELSSLIGKTEL